MNVISAKPFQHRAIAAGVTKELLRDIVREFYRKVRQDALLGPIFNNAISDWDRHIDKVTLFWTTATRVESGYKARDFMPAHNRVAPINDEQISRWLSLFKETLEGRCSDDAAEVLFDIGERMAESIRIALSPRNATEPPA